MEAERIVHGTPSGIDNAISTYGGALRFESGKITPLPRLGSLRVIITNTLVPRCTKLLVAAVRRRVEQFPAIMNPVLVAMDALAREGEGLLIAMATEGAGPGGEGAGPGGEGAGPGGEGAEPRDLEKIFRRLEELIQVNSSLLDCLGVGHVSLCVSVCVSVSLCLPGANTS
ncbi:mevalonate kinase isoform X2 [Petromyzon marinus]|uniref:mevalonate kinase isoform X2 n=1 Tax=Petromyzon marinus TaxID=7757 RepID=UPI003F6E4677